MMTARRLLFVPDIARLCQELKTKNCRAIAAAADERGAASSGANG